MEEKEKQFREELANCFHQIEQTLRRYDPKITDIEIQYDRPHRKVEIIQSEVR